jgi:SAM-dependent methyltransferase
VESSGVRVRGRRPRSGSRVRENGPEKKPSDHDLVANEYATMDRLAMRRLDRTAWLGGEDEPWLLALAAIAEVRPTRVLDAGCGTGDFAALLTAPEVQCIDLSPAAIEAARAKKLRARVTDIQDMPFADGSFDVTVANWVLYHVPDRALAIAELARVLTPTGRFVGCYNAPDHLQELWSQVGVPVAADDFNSVNGPDELRQSFRQVEIKEAHSEVLWENRERVQTYLDAYREMYGPLTAPAAPYPFRATRRNVILVADR